MLTTNDVTRQRGLQDRPEEEQLKMLVCFALVDLSNFYKEKGSKQQYEVNKLLHSQVMK